ncbi:MAG TPA: hypothetical protein VIW64_11780 [Pyrinomonadaceae bacterium]|jgi:hypothetical protein
MVSQSRVLTSALLLLALIAPLLGQTDKKSQPSETNQATSNRQRLEFELGQKLGTALADNSSIVFGTVRGVLAPVRDAEGADAANTASSTKVQLAVDEWLWAAPEKKTTELQLLRLTPPERQKYDNGPWSAWKDAQVAAGNKLIVVLYPKQAGNRAYRGKPYDVALVVSDVSMFPAIREALYRHDRYLRNPGELAAAGAGLVSQPLLLGYTVSYLWRGGSYGNRDNEALALERLLENRELPEPAVSLIKLTLPRFMSSELRSLSDATRRSLLESLVVAGANEDAKVATRAISVLLRLSDRNQLDIAPYLNPERQRKLAENYRASVEKKMIQQRNANFESQLKIVN